MKLCECGCGNAAPISSRTERARGYVAGHPRRFIRGHNRERVATTSHQYVMVRAPWHPRAERSQCVAEHVLIAERALGRFLPDGAEVHHVDGDKKNNANRNLVICQDNVYHALLHFRAAVRARGGDPNTDKWCPKCGATKALSDFALRRANQSHGRSSYCLACLRALGRSA